MNPVQPQITRLPFRMSQMWANRSDVVHGVVLSDLPEHVGNLFIDRSDARLGRSASWTDLSIVAEVRDGFSVLDPSRLVLAPPPEGFYGMSLMLPLPQLHLVLVRATGCEAIDVSIRRNSAQSGGRVLGASPNCALLLLDFGDRFMLTRNGIAADACFRVPVRGHEGQFYRGDSLPSESWFAWTGFGIEPWDGVSPLWFEEED